jgi:ABC-type transporter Mla subunit MlaD
MGWLIHLRTVAAFTAGAAVVLVAPTLWRLAHDRVMNPVDRYRILFNDSVSGLTVGAAVERNGVIVGKVTDISLTNDASPRVIVKVALARGVPVMRDSVVSLGGSLITGVRAIDISGGTPLAGQVHKGQLILADQGSADEDFGRHSAESADQGLDSSEIVSPKRFGLSGRTSMTGGVRDLSTVRRTLRTVGTELSSPERWRSIDATLNNLNHASERLSHTLDRVSVVADSISANRNRFYAALDTTIDRLNNTLDKANQLFATSNRLMASSDELISSTASAVDRNSDQMTHVLSQIDRTTRRLNETLQTIEPNPSTVFWGGSASPKEPQ